MEEHCPTESGCYQGSAGIHCDINSPLPICVHDLSINAYSSLNLDRISPSAENLGKLDSKDGKIKNDLITYLQESKSW